MPTVLVAEDHPDARDLLADILDDAGYEVIEANDGAAAVKKALDEGPDVVLLDVSMPVMDGWDVLEQLRENPRTRRIPVVTVTALNQTKGQLRAWRMDARHYVSKPFSSNQVILSVKVAVRESAAPPRPDVPRLASPGLVDLKVYDGLLATGVL